MTIKNNEKNLTVDEILRQHKTLEYEAAEVREKDKIIIKKLFGDFYNKKLNLGIGFERAWGSMLSGDYFELFVLPDNTYLFVFADISGHGLPAYTTLVRLRSAISLSIIDYQKIYNESNFLNKEEFIRDCGKKFTDIMDSAGSNDFASVIFTIIENYDDQYKLTFFNRGMHFPFVTRKFKDELIDLYDLNIEEKGWIPVKGHLLGSEIRNLLEDKYEYYPSCEFVIYERDSILFFSDGIIEANDGSIPAKEFGFDKLKEILYSKINEKPQNVVDTIFDDVFKFIKKRERQNDDMTAILIDFPAIR